MIRKLQGNSAGSISWRHAAVWVCCAVFVAAGRGQEANPDWPDRGQIWDIPKPPPGIDDRFVPVNWWNVVILVNADSPASIEVAKMYREFYPGIADEQVLYLDGSATPPPWRPARRTRF